MMVRRLSVAPVIMLALASASAWTDNDVATGMAPGMRVQAPFTGPGTLPDGTFGFLLAASDAEAAAATAAGDQDEEPTVVAILPDDALLRASDALSSPLGQEITKRVHAAAEKASLPVMQSGYVLSITDLALTATIMAHASNNPAAWRLPDGNEDGYSTFAEKKKKEHWGKPGGGGGDFLASINAKPPQGLFAWTPEELGELHDEEALAFAAAEQSILAKARRLVFAPLAAKYPSMLPSSAVTLKATEWAWSIARSRCVEPFADPPLPTFEDPITGTRADCVIVAAAAGEVSLDGIADVRIARPDPFRSEPSPSPIAAIIAVKKSGIKAWMERKKAEGAKAPQGMPSRYAEFEASQLRGLFPIQLASPPARTTLENLFQLGVSAPPVGHFFSSPFSFPPRSRPQ